MMLSIIGRPAVGLAQQIDQQSALVARQTRAKREFSGNTIQIMDEQNGIVAPVIANGENCRVANRHDLKIALANLGNYYTHADDSFGPVEERIRIAPLFRDVNMLVAVGPVANH